VQRRLILANVVCPNFMPNEINGNDLHLSKLAQRARRPLVFSGANTTS
jgi:hypothetical protein